MVTSFCPKTKIGLVLFDRGAPKPWHPWSFAASCAVAGAPGKAGPGQLEAIGYRPGQIRLSHALAGQK